MFYFEKYQLSLEHYEEQLNTWSHMLVKFKHGRVMTALHGGLVLHKYNFGIKLDGYAYSSVFILSKNVDIYRYSLHT